MIYFGLHGKSKGIQLRIPNNTDNYAFLTINSNLFPDWIRNITLSQGFFIQNETLLWI